VLAHYIACHNLSFRSVNHLPELYRPMMNDSKITQQISLKRTKCTYQINENVLASVVEDRIVKEMENK